MFRSKQRQRNSGNAEPHLVALRCRSFSGTSTCLSHPLNTRHLNSPLPPLISLLLLLSLRVFPTLQMKAFSSSSSFSLARALSLSLPPPLSDTPLTFLRLRSKRLPQVVDVPLLQQSLQWLCSGCSHLLSPRPLCASLSLAEASVERLLQVLQRKREYLLRRRAWSQRGRREREEKGGEGRGRGEGEGWLGMGSRSETGSRYRSRYCPERFRLGES